MRAISILAAYKVASKTFLFHLMMFIVLWTFSTPKCDDDACSYFLTDAILKLKIMHAILFGSQLLIEFLNLLQTKTKNLNDAAYKLALVVSEVLKVKGGQERTKEELLKLKDTLEEAKKENEEFKEA